jgi:voltage-gated sodium channel
MLTWIPELNVILHSIGSSVRALGYVIMLLFAFFFHFGIAGIFLFAENDPRHFGSLWQAFVTLFQVTSHYLCKLNIVQSSISQYHTKLLKS